MVLPSILSLEDCVSFSKTVLPYVSQLYDLPQKLFENYSNTTELQNIYLATNPLIFGFALSLFLAPIFLLLSEINRNFSQVDRVWSILPTVYNAHFVLYAHLSGIPTSRLDNLLAFSTVWSLRLTYNYWRKGGYNIGSEDYRWEIIRAKVPAAAFFLFNVTFISLAQSVLLFLISTPTYVLLLASKLGVPFGGADIIFARVLMGLILITFFADQQQWNFQQAKKLYQKTAKVPPKFAQADLDRGFVVTGLWSWCRHPNFAAEQMIWITLYVWSCFTADVIWNWTGIGAMSYVILFQGSTWFTELITAGKYPEYEEYQLRVNRFLPRFSTDISGELKAVEAAEKETKKQKPSYVPKPRSGAYAIMMALSSVYEQQPRGIPKQELIELAEEHCDPSSTTTDPTNEKLFTAWNSMKSLQEKDLVFETARTGSVRRYGLTDEGWETVGRIKNSRRS